ncbi:MAG: DUF3613 domain-containing protein [Pseudomonadota bacterium]
MTFPASPQPRGVRYACVAVLSTLASTAAMAQTVPLTPMTPVTEVRVPEASPAPAANPLPQTVPLAHGAPASVAVSEAAEVEWKPALKVGEATSGLFALQASGAAASRTTRAVPGEVAGRSYQRYLKSFEYPIPEKFGATVKSSGTNSGGGTP